MDPAELQALEDCDRSPDVRVVIVTGAGRAFCAGDDLRGMSERENRIADTSIR